MEREEKVLLVNFLLLPSLRAHFSRGSRLRRLLDLSQSRSFQSFKNCLNVSRNCNHFLPLVFSIPWYSFLLYLITYLCSYGHVSQSLRFSWIISLFSFEWYLGNASKMEQWFRLNLSTAHLNSVGEGKEAGIRIKQSFHSHSFQGSWSWIWNSCYW